MPAMPHTLGSIVVSNAKTPAQIKAAMGWAARHGRLVAKGTDVPETQVVACPRVRVADLPVGFVKQKWIEQQEQNQKIASCCRHPENHDIEAFKSHPDEQAPDIYILHCTCGKRHVKFCVGMEDVRPTWNAG